MTSTFFVEVIHKTSRGGGNLLRYKVEAGSHAHAYGMVRAMLGMDERDVMAGYITCDPAKVDRFTA